MKKLGDFHYYLERIFDMAAMSLLWLVCCLPVVTIGASTTALYYTVNKVWKNGRGYVAEEFWGSFKMNLKPATLLWAVLAAAMVIVQLNLGIVREKMPRNMGIFFTMLYWFCLFIVWGIQLYAFPALSRFDMPVGWILKLSIYMCFRHLGRTLVLLAITAAAFFLAYQSLLFIIILPFAAHYLYNYLLEPVLKIHMPVVRGNQEVYIHGNE